ncbi:MAG: twin transmembrane helix small protein [Parvibaculum sp.]|nr:twin transmembrane helix small protein [Parvibaculum sp.]
MTEFIDYLAPAAMIAVLVVLIAGLWNMMRGGSASRSQTLMRWRVGLQFFAVIVIMAGLYLTSR